MPQENPPDISIILVHYRTEKLLGLCLKALATSLNAAGRRSEVFVVDNGSDAQKIAGLKQFFGKIHWIHNGANEGFARACNQALKLARGKHILLLNPDCLIAAQTIPRMLKHMESDERIGLAGPRHRYPDGKLQPTCREFPTLGNVAAEQLFLNKLFPRSSRWNAYKMGGFAHDQVREVDQLMGSCLFMRRALLEEIGALDERFFMYFEEVDLCRRAKQAGWKVMFFPDEATDVSHAGGASSDQDVSARVTQRYRSLCLWHRKHSSPAQIAAVKGAVLAGLLLRTAAFGISGKSRLSRAHAAALAQWPSW